MSLLKSALVALAALASFSGASAFAETVDSSEQVTVRIRVADLNLYSEQGVATMMKRINRAADYACGGYPDVGPNMLEFVPVYEKCKSNVMESAVAQMDSPLLTVRFAEMTGRATLLASR